MTEPANLIFIQSDNHNRDLLGAYGHPAGANPAPGPTGRARGAFRTTPICASSLCCPSRAALATGRYPHQTAYWDNCLVYDGRRPSWMQRLSAQGHECVSVE